MATLDGNTGGQRLWPTLLATFVLVVTLLYAGGAAAAAPAGPHAARAVGPVSVPPVTHPTVIGAPFLSAGIRHSNSNHYWAGSYYSSSTNARSTVLSVNLTVPDASASSSEFYYVLLSVWDSAASYDQIGFANDYGTWGWTWSYTSSCAGNYYYTADQRGLTAGITYTFTMTLDRGTIWFNVSHLGSAVGSVQKTTGGGYFDLSGYYTCGGGSYYDYTDYEESYATSQSVPSFPFLFRNNTGNGTLISSFSSFNTASSFPGSLIVKGPNTTIANEQFFLSFVGHLDSANVPQGTNVSTNITVARLFGSDSIDLAVSGVGTGVHVVLKPSSGTGGYTAELTFRIRPRAATGYYGITVKGTIVGSGLYTYVTFRLTIN